MTLEARQWRVLCGCFRIAAAALRREMLLSKATAHAYVLRNVHKTVPWTPSGINARRYTMPGLGREVRMKRAQP
eukprot:3213983-Rhodomonas_salina.2